MTTFLFQAAVDAAQVAKGIEEAHAGRMMQDAMITVEPYFIQTVSVGYRRRTKSEKVGEPEKVANFENSRINKLVEEFFRANLPDALKYAHSVMQGAADTAMLAAKGQVEDLLEQINAIEAAANEVRK